MCVLRISASCVLRVLDEREWPTYPVSPVMMTTRCDVTASRKDDRADEAGSDARTDNIYHSTHIEHREHK